MLESLLTPPQVPNNRHVVSLNLFIWCWINPSRPRFRSRRRRSSVSPPYCHHSFVTARVAAVFGRVTCRHSVCPYIVDITGSLTRSLSEPCRASKMAPMTIGEEIRRSIEDRKRRTELNTEITTEIKDEAVTEINNTPLNKRDRSSLNPLRSQPLSVHESVSICMAQIHKVLTSATNKEKVLSSVKQAKPVTDVADLGHST